MYLFYTNKYFVTEFAGRFGPNLKNNYKIYVYILIEKDLPLSNFLPSGSISLTLKISSNKTPAIFKY